MDDPFGLDQTLLLVLNLTGTFVFAISGGLAAVKARLDLFGVIVLANVVGMAGGIIRDLLIGVPPETFGDWRFLATATAAGVVCFYARPLLDRLERPVLTFDAIGLSLFCVTGATKALDLGLGPAQAIALGTITGIGGGILRDILLRNVPVVLRQELYAVPALLGAAIVVVGDEIGASGVLFAFLGAGVCLTVRLLALQYGLHMPVAPSERDRSEEE
ncbi:trimeric intracellular cation channel family protein [Thermoleophilia bacterium SCSIO 60948]|nr:trimeric intracellular cation channel family protein [Thermoleophilia bacterium SCSIO 60948]